METKHGIHCTKINLTACMAGEMGVAWFVTEWTIYLVRPCTHANIVRNISSGISSKLIIYS